MISEIWISIRYWLWYISVMFMHRLINPLFLRGMPDAWKAPTPPIDEVFPNHKLFDQHYKAIRDEVLQMLKSNAMLHPVEDLSPSLFNWITSYTNKQATRKAPGGQWKTLNLRCYGQDNHEALNQCQTLKTVMDQLPEVKLCIISAMEPSTIIPAHRGPSSAVIRFHMPLMVPGYSVNGVRQPNQDPDKCKIVIGEDMTQHIGLEVGGCLPGTTDQQRWPTIHHSWKPGHGFVFDDTYAHDVRQMTEEPRIVLFVDICRFTAAKLPPAWSIGSMLSFLLNKIGFHAFVFLLNGRQERTTKYKLQ
jgi:aspartyl/asparaginyl beta-hydroxylase (cupin superfamily)